MESYSHLPEGCEEHPHATWEPDECLPDEFDVPWLSGCGGYTPQYIGVMVIVDF